MGCVPPTMRTMILVLSLQAYAQIVPPTIVQRVDPGYDASITNYVLDPAVVKVVIDEHGNPYSLDSITSLPDNVVVALSKWKFRPGTKDGKTVPFTVPVSLAIRRRMDELGQLAIRPSSTDFGAWEAAISDGLKLSPATATKLEQKLKDNAESANSRASLLKYAAMRMEKEARQLHARQISWFVHNQPDSGLLSDPVTMLFTAPGPYQNVEGYEQVKALWLEQLSARPDDQAILGHAAYFLRLSDPEATENLLLPAVPKLGAAAVWLGELYGLSALGVKSLDYESGLPVDATPTLPEMGFGKSARSLLGSTNDARIVLPALATVSDGGRSLAGSGKIPVGFANFCQELLVHARSLYAETKYSCEGPPIHPGGSVEPLHIAKRAAPAYPPEAMARRLEGKVLFKAVIGKDGKIRLLELLSAPLAFYDSARSAISRWEYQPSRLRGEPAEVTTQLVVNYALH
jgi:hypothetical protein